MSNLFNTELDLKFKELSDLKLLPWVGIDYLKVPEENRIFFVGESHYEKNELHLLYTRNIIDSCEIDNYKSLRIFANLKRGLFRTNHINIQSFWSSIAFCNLVQIAMKTIKDRPTRIDFIEGWKVFFKVIEVLKPSTCILIGLTSANFLKNALDAQNIKSNGLKWDEKIGKSESKCIELEVDGHTVQLIFIAHTSSRMFSSVEWNKYLVKKINNQIIWLLERVK